jgi:hypothetical protein
MGIRVPTVYLPHFQDFARRRNESDCDRGRRLAATCCLSWTHRKRKFHGYVHARFDVGAKALAYSAHAFAKFLVSTDFSQIRGTFANTQRFDALAASRDGRCWGIAMNHVDGIFRNIEADSHVALRAEMIDFVRNDALEQLGKTTGVGQIREMHEEFRVAFVPIRKQMIHTLGVKTTGAALDAVDFVTFGEEQFREVRAVLTGDAGYEGSFWFCCVPATY